MKYIVSILACICCLATPMQVNAAETEGTLSNTASSEEITPAAAGLISSYSLGCSAGTKVLYINADTTGYEEMSEIGFTDIKIQRSSDLTTWTTEKTVSDKIKEDASIYSLANYSVSVQGGYYYRVKLTHYAKEQGGFFPDDQSVTNTSNYVWIS